MPYDDSANMDRSQYREEAAIEKALATGKLKICPICDTIYNPNTSEYWHDLGFEIPHCKEDTECSDL